MSADRIHEVADILDAMDRKSNPVGMTRMIFSGQRMDGLISIQGLPGSWRVKRSWDENGVWAHDIVRVL